MTVASKLQKPAAPVAGSSRRRASAAPKSAAASAAPASVPPVPDDDDGWDEAEEPDPAKPADDPWVSVNGGQFIVALNLQRLVLPLLLLVQVLTGLRVTILGARTSAVSPSQLHLASGAAVLVVDKDMVIKIHPVALILLKVMILATDKKTITKEHDVERKQDKAHQMSRLTMMKIQVHGMKSSVRNL